MRKTLGGDRLGSGKKMGVELHGYERSTHDLGYLWRSTMSVGTLVPFLSEVALPGDTFDIDLEVDVKTHPTVGPLFGSMKIQLDVFQAPIRLYNSLLHNNALNIGRNMSVVKLPQIIMAAVEAEYPTSDADVDNIQINPSSLLAYLGLRGVGLTGTTTSRSFNAVPIIAYWDIYKNYYSNKQEEFGYSIHTPQEPLLENVGTISYNGDGIGEVPEVGLVELVQGEKFEIIYTGGIPPIPSQIMIQTQYHGTLSLAQLGSRFEDNGVDTLTILYNFAYYGLDYAINWRYRNVQEIVQVEPVMEAFVLENIDAMRNAILASQSQVTPFTINELDLTPYKNLYAQPVPGQNAVLSSQEGLGIKTYQSDLFNNWLQTEWIDGAGGITEVTAIDTTGGSFTLDTLNLSKKIYDMLNRIAVSGGTYDDWLDAVYTHDRYMRAETPMYMGGLSRELVFQEVISNTASGEETAQPLGTLGGRGVLGQKKKGGHVTIKVDEPSYIIGIISITPRIDYSQGNKWDMHLKTIDDLHKPALDEIGFQELITEQMAWWDTQFEGGEWAQKSAGKQPAWINYMTNTNRTLGNFAIRDNEMFMTLNRRYDWNGSTIGDLTTYIDPTKFNFIFANTSIDAQNYWVQIATDITARRKMSAKIMPNL